MVKQKCDYCNRKPITWITYEGLHVVCSKHKKAIMQLAQQGLLGAAFLKAIENLTERR